MQEMDFCSEYLELSGKGKLRVKQRKGSGAWEIRLPGWPWRFAAAQEERNSLVSRLAGKFPFAALWSPADGDWTNPFAWSFPDGSQLPKLVKSLGEGAWTLFFFADDPGTSLRGLPMAPLRTEELKEALTSMSARAAISSWYDDWEWLLIIADLIKAD